jgi:hypothetical protein
MNRNGVALVMSLVVLVAVTGLAGSTLFLTRFQFRIVENARSAAVASAQVDAGLTAALVSLYEIFIREGSLPTASIEVPVAEGYAYDVVDYKRYSTRSARLVVEAGTGSGRFRGEALIRLDPGPPEELFRAGLVAGGSISMTGTISSAANLWAGGTIDLSDPEARLEGHATAMAAGEYCQIGVDTCATGVEAPSVPEVDFERLRQDVVVRSQPCSRTFSRQDVVLNRIDGETICLEEGATLIVTEEVSDATILGDASTVVRMDRGATGITTLVSGQVVFGTLGAVSGEVVVVAKQDLTVTGDILSVDELARSVVATEGVVQFAGGGRISGVVWSNGGVDLTGHASLQGAVVTSGAITAAEGSITLDLAGGVANDVLPGSGLPVLRVVSRR